MNVFDWVTIVFMTVGAIFFLAGTVGLLRFPDAPSRLHALTKADNLGLGLVVIGLVMQASSPAVAVKLLVVWILVLVASATIAQLIGQFAYRAGGSTEE